MPKLYILQGSDKGHNFDINSSPIMIGRNSPDIPIKDNTVSRRHAELIRKSNDCWIIRDLTSSNGTYLNGVKIDSFMELKQGDQIRCGATLIAFGGIQSNSIAGDPGGLRIDADGNLIESAIMATIPSMDDSVIIAAPETLAAVNNLKLLYELSNAINTVFDSQQLLDRVMDMIFNNLPTDRGFILMRDDADSDLKPIVVRYRDSENSGEITISRTIVDHVLRTHEGVICSNAMRDPRFAKGKSVQNYGIRSALCAPITVRDQIIGVIYVDTTVATHTYATEQLQLLTAIGYQTGVAMEHTRLYHAGVQAERLAAAGETVAYISHGIKNILQGLQSAGDMVEMGFNKKKYNVAQKGWTIVQRNLTRVQNLVLNMLAFSKVRQPNLIQTQLNHLIAEIIEMLAGQAIEKKIGLFTDLDESLPAIPVDPDGIQQVILNLILNAMDVIPQGKGIITVKTKFDTAKNEAVISVTDNGPGIPKDIMNNIFKAFSSSKGQGGTGLGLAVVKKITEEHDGNVTVESKTGEGTTFVIHLPTSNAVEDSTSTAI
ncbi:MAG: FHA domain-containing protein [Phycisphaerae bacterium]|nr:FHA domain-containing protein [Phycisphaerae bacterium]